MIATMGYLVINATDATGLAQFWGQVLGADLDYVVGEGEFVVLTKPDGGVPIVFQKVTQTKGESNRLHLDLIVEDLEDATAAVLALGGSWLVDGHTHELDGYRWRTMTDPEGNEFDLQVQPAA